MMRVSSVTAPHHSTVTRSHWTKVDLLGVIMRLDRPRSARLDHATLGAVAKGTVHHRTNIVGESAGADCNRH